MPNGIVPSVAARSQIGLLASHVQTPLDNRTLDDVLSGVILLGLSAQSGGSSEFLILVGSISFVARDFVNIGLLFTILSKNRPAQGIQSECDYAEYRHYKV